MCQLNVVEGPLVTSASKKVLPRREWVKWVWTVQRQSAARGRFSDENNGGTWSATAA